MKEFTDHINDDDGVLAKAARALVEVRLIELEGGDVRREYRGVDHKDKDQPIPSGLERNERFLISLKMRSPYNKELRLQISCDWMLFWANPFL